MNCQKFESVVPDLARGQMMESEVRNDALVHSSECNVCSSRLRNEEALTRSLRAVAVEMKSLDVPPSVEARLLQAFRQPNVVVPISGDRSYKRYWLTAIAAMLLIVLGVVAFRLNERTPESPQYTKVEPPKVSVPNPGVQQVHAPEPVNSGTSSDVEQVAVSHKPKALKKRSSINSGGLQASAGRSRGNAVQSNHAEIATEFMPLGYLNPRSLQDGGQIVRVEVPRTTLASFGLPVNMERFDEKVKADILFGVDGRARAIRFVQNKREE